ncbi:lytic transglycosylase [Zobellella endophytica]|uniref:Lytic transglycosylase n=1 Tax=Zobellella endophytica TaxID=2116700 RepID=A0A2P7R984_9GAMM|nr:lytic transglycosylase domain-containing protein [Zobellella endophytica]PSJ46750.1 lytic transglycosylase [Zobellella endophytica]
MKSTTLLWLCTVLATSARADVYMEIAEDGSITLTNIYPAGRNHVLLLREPPPPPRASAPSAPGKRPYAEIIADAAQEHELPETLLHAVIHAESNYNPTALSPKGAAGLMQLMPDTAKALGVADVWEPTANIRGGARYLKQLMGMFDNDLSLALAAYNAGPGAVRRRGDTIPPFPETRRYVSRVIDHYQRLRDRPR